MASAGSTDSTQMASTMSTDLTAMTSARSTDSTAMADFSLLPDVVWVRIMSYLSLKDRSSVSQTCHILSDIFHHPSLWYSACVQLLGDTAKYKKIPLMKPEQYLQMVQKFGPYIQDLRLMFRGYTKKTPESCREVILALTENCRFESLHLEVSSVITYKELSASYGRRNTDLQVLGELVKKAYRLKSFTLAAWPIYDGLRSVNILDMLTQNERVKDTLQKLSLFWLEADRSTWATLNVILPSPQQVIQTLQHFSNLHSLRLRSTMINDAVIAQLAGANSVRLESLGILVTFDRHAKKGAIPEIGSLTWCKLVERCPGLKVEFNIVTKIPFVELAGLLKPEIPVCSISFMKYSGCSNVELESIADKYGGSLQKFADYSSDAETELDSDLINLVTKATSLTQFVYTGAMSIDTVETLATLRGPKWREFQIDSSHVQTQAMTALSLDPDVVVGKSEDGSFFLARHHRELSASQSEEDREGQLMALIAKVAQILEKSWWQPMDRLEGFNFPDEDVATWPVTPRIYGMIAGR